MSGGDVTAREARLRALRYRIINVVTSRMADSPRRFVDEDGAHLAIQALLDEYALAELEAAEAREKAACAAIDAFKEQSDLQEVRAEAAEARLKEAQEARERADGLLRAVVAAEKLERLPGDHAVSVALLSVDEYLASARKERSNGH